MAPSSGHLLVPKILRIIKFSVSKTTALVKSKLPSSTYPYIPASTQPIRITSQSQPIHPIAFLKQSRSQASNRWFSTSSSQGAPIHTGPRYDRSKFPSSRISRVISQKGPAPFATTLRPNLTGGALPRSAGGYGLGGGARHFSHTSGAQAQVVQNVSAGIRAFCLNGGKARFDGVDAVTGEKRFRTISRTENAVLDKWQSPMAKLKGTNVDFHLSPTITALIPSFGQDKCDPKSGITSLNEIDLLDTLATDFARALRDLALVLRDLRLLASFGDLPISMQTTPSGPVLSVRFPGCDADLVMRLCDEAGVKRGIVVEDEGWAADEMGEKDVEMALLFPFAPGSVKESEDDNNGRFYFDDTFARQEKLEWRGMLEPANHNNEKKRAESSVQDNVSFEDLASTLRSHVLYSASPSPSGYESLRESDVISEALYSPSYPALSKSSHKSYEGVEGIYKFLKECEDVRPMKL